MTDSPEEIKKHIPTYYKVFGALCVMTIVTVTVAWVELGVGLAIVAALAIALFKGSLVANFFMHLNHEKKVIYYSLILTGMLFVPLMVLPVWTVNDTPFESVDDFEFHHDGGDEHSDEGAHEDEADHEEGEGDDDAHEGEADHDEGDGDDDARESEDDHDGDDDADEHQDEAADGEEEES